MAFAFAVVLLASFPGLWAAVVLCAFLADAVNALAAGHIPVPGRDWRPNVVFGLFPALALTLLALSWWACVKSKALASVMLAALSVSMVTPLFMFGSGGV